ncbi:chorismate synthase signature 1 [Lucifera butyrica]|uniref:Chorismate synthase n=1 Tax=Lucifera butyrica TaxID=1351585 RepID=A0A498RCJ1_9FIRM|nr:chorismate synthase [Lucifera butyrica]VBB06868.1 chorismate synthase signature 1 [Lucifera butyrica]
MFRFLTSGESHGACLTATIEGLPAGIQIDVDKINKELARRQQGYGRGGRMKIEKDSVEIVSGVRFGFTLGSPVTLIIRNRDWANWEERMAVEGSEHGDRVICPRPGHADLSGVLKYQRQDVRDILERASARETAARVAVGSIARQVLAACGICVASHVTDIGGAAVAPKSRSIAEILRDKEGSDLGCVEPAAEQKMKQLIQAAKEQGDSLGGVFEVVAENIMPGLGSYVHWDRRLDTRLAAAVMSIPAIKGVEIGAGFEYAALPGSMAHDEIFYEPERGVYRQTNRAGGIEGGMTNGQPVVVRAVMKPIPTLMTPLASVNIATHEAVKANTERSDVCAVSAAAVVGEAMTAIVLAESLLEKFGGDSMEDIITAVRHYQRRIAW